MRTFLALLLSLSFAQGATMTNMVTDQRGIPMSGTVTITPVTQSLMNGITNTLGPSFSVSCRRGAWSANVGQGFHYVNQLGIGSAVLVYINTANAYTNSLAYFASAATNPIPTFNPYLTYITNYSFTNNVSTINVRSVGAIGDASTDDTAAFQDALDLADDLKLPVYVPTGKYKISDSLVIPPMWGFRMYGDGPTNSIIWQTDGTKNALQFYSARTDEIDPINKLHDWKIYDLAFFGPTNCGWGSAASGIFIGDPWCAAYTNGNPYGFQTNGIVTYGTWLGRLEDIWVIGFPNGITLSNTVDTKLVIVAANYNTNAGIFLHRGDGTYLDTCTVGGLGAVGSGPDDTSTCLVNVGGGTSTEVMGGDWGNSKHIYYQKGGYCIWLGGNCEAFYGDYACMIEDYANYTEVGKRTLAGSGTTNSSPYRIKPNGAVTPAIRIVNPYTAGFAANLPPLEFIGNYPISNLPIYDSPTTTTTNIIVKDAVGGTVLRMYAGSSITDKHKANTWEDIQTFKSTSEFNPSIRIVNGSQYYGLQVGADWNASTLTAANQKGFYIAGVSYSNATHNFALLNYVAVSNYVGGGDIVTLGGDPYSQLKAVQEIRFRTTSTYAGAGFGGTNHWTIQPDGDFVGNANACRIYADGVGVTNVGNANLTITTNATPPGDLSTIKAWLNVTLSDGAAFKMPLYQ